ncbi:MAG: hypothetical protein KIT08_09720 [Anaerolineales bacterium]|nr:MAG: hypothetical protein KIT08_09720 [Anaerolineales bacterium]
MNSKPDPIVAVSQWRAKLARSAGQLALFFVSLWLFILAISLMKAGAQALGPFIQSVFALENFANSLGFGWLLAYGVMSGSPVAAAALTFFDAGIVRDIDAFAMITGSRLGASLIVLLIGFVYVLRGRNRAESLGMGLVSFCVTGSTYLVALLPGYLLLSSHRLDAVQLQSGAILSSVIDSLFDPVVHLLDAWLPGWMLFVVGLGVILLSFRLFDDLLPTETIKNSRVGQLSRLTYKPIVMFVLGSFITMISMSVSVSISILVPLSQRGLVRRENVIPYIMGANITTFIDTLLAAVLLVNPRAFTVVLVEMLSISMVSVVILALFYSSYEQWVLRFVNWLVNSNRNLAVFIAVIFTAPLLLLLL